MSASTDFKPTARQLTYLRALAARTATTFAAPATRRQASREIARLRTLARQPHTPASETYGEQERLAYATAVDASEIAGFGSSARWRHSTPRSSKAASPTAPERVDVVESELGRYAAPDGESRRVLMLTRPDERVLVVDAAIGETLRDCRLLATLAPDEPLANAQLVCEMYLADPRRVRCRALCREDLLAGEVRKLPMAVEEFVGEKTALLDGHGRVYAIREVSVDEGVAQLRWTRAASPDAKDAFDVLSLRDVVGALEAYEAAWTITMRVLEAEHDRERLCIARLREEARRLASSPIVLNRRLREVVQARVAAGETLSEIALRCGRAKRSDRGALSGETSWLARRIGQIPDSGAQEPTPWIHSDTLALIAREGLGISPREVEL